jgi:hypothetical protein
MRRWFLGAAAGLSLAVAAVADDPPKKDDPPPKKDDAKKDDAPKTPAEQLRALQKEVSEASAEVSKAMRERKDEKDKEANEKVTKAFEAYNKKQSENAAKALELAKQDPKSDVAADAIAWAMQGLRGNREAIKEAVALLKEHHIASPKIRTAINVVQYAGLPEDQVADFLNAVAEKNPDKATKAAALMGLGESYKNKAEPRGGKPPADADQWRKKAEDTYERVAKEFADVKSYGDNTFADLAKGELFEIRNLAIGQPVPDIEGEDLDGVKFKLSDYKGKVVLIDFWGDW